ncbi:MAG: hypothetical protein KDI73_03330 [Candidatus Competibacteraceae bacterium]|nr:hypothetical protein [Candidatus Competibacteraceae bacterium]
MDEIIGFFNEYILPKLVSKVDTWLLILVTLLIALYTRWLVSQAIKSSVISEMANNIDLHSSRIDILQGIEKFEMDVNINGYRLNMDVFRSLNKTLDKADLYFSDKEIENLVSNVRQNMHKAIKFMNRDNKSDELVKEIESLIEKTVQLKSLIKKAIKENLPKALKGS